MTPRAWLFFCIVSVLWGIPYFFIKIAVAELSPLVVVFVRVAIGALVLLPVALHGGALQRLRGRLGTIVALAGFQVVAPFLLITFGELSISSSLTGILIATEPLIIALLALRLDRTERISGWRLIGLLVGMLGVVLALGVDLGSPALLRGAALVLLASVSYSISPLLVKRWFADVPPLGISTAMLAVSAVALTVPAAFALPRAAPSPQVLAALATLGVACTSLGFISFYVLIGLAGPTRAGVIAYASPAVALALGVGLRGEPFTAPIAAGFALILAGSWLGTRAHTSPGRAPGAAAPALGGRDAGDERRASR